MARVRKIDTFTIPDGAGGGSISPAVPLRLGAPFCQSKTDVNWFAVWGTHALPSHEQEVNDWGRNYNLPVCEILAGRVKTCASQEIVEPFSLLPSSDSRRQHFGFLD
jgi:hypothetical protein